MKVLSITGVAAVVALTASSPGASALTTDTVGFAASEQRTWESFVEYAIEYQKEYRSLDNNHDLVQRRYQVR